MMRLPKGKGSDEKGTKRLRIDRRDIDARWMKVDIQSVGLLVKNRDTITIDAEKRELTLEVPSAALKKRKKAWKKPAPRYTRGVLAKYAAHVTSASFGAVTDAELKL